MPGIYISVIVPGVILLPVITAIIRKKHWGPPESLVFVYLLISGLFNVLAALLAARRINNLPLLHLYTVIEFLVISGFFYAATDNLKERRVIKIMWIAFPIIALLTIFSFNSLFVYNQVPRSIEAIIILIFCIHFFMKSLSFSAAPVPFFNFATVVALLLYFSGSLALFALSNFIIGNKTINSLIWNTHATFVLIMYLIIAVAYFKTRKDQ
jgi:hypothetical protein